MIIRRFYKHRFFLIAAILSVGFALRVIGLNLGLPLWVVSDEPSPIFGALKMIELKTLLPILHIDEFQGVFYYMPFFAYLYLVPFLLVLGFKFLLFGGGLELFKWHMIADPSAFFMMARIISVVLGTATIWLVYKSADNIFRSRTTALYAATFLALSWLHVNYSHWARHWVVAAFFFALVVYILSLHSVEPRRRYIAASLISALGFGVSQQILLVIFYLPLWFFLYDKLSLGKEIRRLWTWVSTLIFLIVSGAAFLIWPAAWYGGPHLIAAGKGGLDLLRGYGYYLAVLAKSEPLFLLFVLIGFIVQWRFFRRFFWVAFWFTVFYIGIFSMLFSDASRFMLPLYPLFSLIAAGGLNYIIEQLIHRRQRRAAYFIAVVVFMQMFFVVLKFDFLLMRNDTRLQARQWVYSTLPTTSPVVVAASLMRLSTTAEMIQEQKSIDSHSLRSVDQAEVRLPLDLKITPPFRVLNVSAVDTDIFWDNFENYIKNHKYQYIIFSPVFLQGKGVNTAPLLESRRIVKKFTASPFPGESITNGIAIGLGKLFMTSMIGEDIIISKLF